MVPGTPSRALAITLAGLLALPSLPAQEAPKGRLHIEIIEGKGATNNIRQRIAREPIVEVQDENNKPVAGAAVVFLLPDTGPSGVFPNGTRVLTLTTDANGRAAGTGLKPNTVAGQFEIRVTASFQGMTASTTIPQTNALIGATAAAGISGKMIGILVGVGAAAAGGALIATRSGGNGGSSTPTPSRPTVSISAGAPNVGPPPR